jgi:hypothetical protein
VIHQNPAHGACRYRKEVVAILPVDGGLAKQLHVRFVDERGGVEGAARPAARNLPPRCLPQMLVHEADQAVERLAITGAMPVEELSDVAGARVCSHERFSTGEAPIVAGCGAWHARGRSTR